VTPKLLLPIPASNALGATARAAYHVHKLIEKYGRMANLMKWREMLNADCPKRDAHLSEHCGKLVALGFSLLHGEGSPPAEAGSR
jgi:hypothetical protein